MISYVYQSFLNTVDPQIFPDNNLNPEIILILQDLISCNKIMAKFGIPLAFFRKVSTLELELTQLFMNTPIMSNAFLLVVFSDIESIRRFLPRRQSEIHSTSSLYEYIPQRESRQPCAFWFRF